MIDNHADGWIHVLSILTYANLRIRFFRWGFVGMYLQGRFTDDVSRPGREAVYVRTATLVHFGVSHQSAVLADAGIVL